MNSALLIVAILLAALILWLAAQISQSQKKSSALESQLTELRRDLLSIAQTQSQSAGQIQSIGQSVSQRLESVTKALHDGVTSSAHIATQGQTADAAIFLRDKKLMAIDSKFPLDAFRRIESDGDEARRAFATAVKGHADSIAKKYIVPNEGTLDVALMFVPSENVYCEMLNTLDNKGQAIDAYCRDKKIIAVSPNTLYANLCVIAMGLRGMQIEENAKRILGSLSGMQKQMETFTDFFEKLGSHLKNAQQSYSEADRRLEKTQDTLGGMLGLAPAQATLPLPPPPDAK